MYYLTTSMVLATDESEPLPKDFQIPTFVIKGKSKEDILKRLYFHLELYDAIIKHDGVDGIDYQSIARNQCKRILIKRKY